MDLSYLLAMVATAALFGGMVFFPSVIAPRVFQVLPPEEAGHFLRDIFPRYYLFIVITSMFAAIGFLALDRLLFLIMIFIAISTLAVRQLLVPMINAWRDRAVNGCRRSQKRFERGHRASVIVNGIQLLAVFWVLAQATLTIDAIGLGVPETIKSQATPAP